MRMPYTVRRIAGVAIVAVAVLLAGCARQEEPGHRVGEYTIDLRTDPDPPQAGMNTFMVKITDKSGTPVGDATIHIHYSMPAMAGMPAMGDEVVAQSTEDGRYEAQIDLGAGGKFPWDVTVEVVRNEAVLAVTRWQITPGTKGVKFVAGEGRGGEAAVDYYTCTMHPSVKEKQPGKCPICAMNLVPVYQEGAPPPGHSEKKAVRTVSVPLYQQQLIGVQLDTVRRRGVSKTIRSIGHVAYDETKVATVNLKFSGWIEKLYVDYIGKFVKKGQALFEIYSPELVSTQEEYLQALRRGSNGARFTGRSQRAESAEPPGRSRMLESARNRLLLWGISAEQIAKLEHDGVPSTRLMFYSPITGYVVEKRAVEGGHVKAGSDLYTIVDLATVWVHAEVYEYELPLIHVGQRAIIRLSYEPGVEYTGRVDYIYPSLQARTRTATIRLIFPNPELKLKLDMYADVEIEAGLGEHLVVSETAVLDTGARQMVFVDRGQGRFEPREIKLGPKAGRYYVVLEGLQPGEVVVKSGNFLIDAEAHVQGVLQTM